MGLGGSRSVGQDVEASSTAQQVRNATAEPRFVGRLQAVMVLAAGWVGFMSPGKAKLSIRGFVI